MSSEDDLQAVIGGAERGREGGVQLGLRAVEGSSHVGQVDGLAFRGGEPSRGQEDVGRAKDCADTGVSVDPEILIIIDAHGSLHDQSCYRLTVGDVGVDSDKPGGPHGDPSGVGRIEDTNGAFLYQVDESLLAVVLRRMVAGKRGDGDVAAPHLPAHRDADNLGEGFPSSEEAAAKSAFALSSQVSPT